MRRQKTHQGGVKGVMVIKKLAPGRWQNLLWPFLLALTVLLGVYPGQAEESGPPAKINPEKNFTIVRIEPDAVKEEVRVIFSHPIPLEVIKPRLRFLPPVKIDWDKSSMSQDGVLTLSGTFRYGARHLIDLPPTLTYDRRTYLKTVNSFFLPDMLPRAEFVDPKSVMERDSRQLLPVRVRNLDRVLVEGIRTPPLLLPVALAFEQKPGDWGQLRAQLQAGVEELKSLLQGEAPRAVRPSAALQKALSPFITTPVEARHLFATQGEKNRPRAFSLPLTFRPDRETGTLELIRLQGQSEAAPAAGEVRLFRLTDLGLTYKVGETGLLLWVTSLKSGAPMAGVQVLAFTRDLEVFPVGQTDQDGILIIGSRELEGVSLKQPGSYQVVKGQVGPPQITALLTGTAGDVSFVEIRPQGHLRPERVWQEEESQAIRNRRGFVFTDRGVYRVGEKVSFKGSIREYQEGGIAPPGKGAFSFTITSPRGENIFSQEATLSDFGSAWGELALQPHLPRGTYTLALNLDTGETADDAATPGDNGDEAPRERPPQEATCTFQVQDFRPPRHFVDIGFKRFSRPEDRYVNRPRTQEFVRITISATYYAGGPVKHGQVRWKVNKATTSFRVEGFDDFTFGSAVFDKPDLLESGQAILDENGRAEVEFPLEPQVLAGLMGLSVTAAVVDFDGRTVANTRDFQADPALLVGIGRHQERLRAGQEQLLKVIVTQKGNKITRGQVRAEVLQRSGAYVAKRNDQGDVYWDYQDIWRKLYADDLTIDRGEASFRFDFSWGGQYLVSFSHTDKEGRTFASSTIFEVTGDFLWDDFDNRDKPYQALAISADRPAYEPGQTARIMVSPRRPVSHYLITLETDGILEHRVMAATPGLQVLEIPLKAAYAPNVYLSVLGLTPRGVFPAFANRYDSEAPGFFWGNLNLPVRREAERLQVQISPGAKELRAEPGNKVELDFIVMAKDGRGVEAEMAVAVVDERILALTAFKTPDPEPLVQFIRPLQVFTGELRTLLMHQTPYYLARNEPLTGGGGLEPG
ncbi:MAG: hypothetical protein FJ135_12250, partial [Deltaproteobacteria bacterium]|nr:hypothetical protein [Deltaproteobacteria bacterium]